MTPGIAIGELCPECAAAVARRASRLARWVAMGTTLLLAVYVAVTLPPQRNARILAAAATVAWYVLTHRIVRRVAWEWMK